jgi:hypothetical protein
LQRKTDSGRVKFAQSLPAAGAPAEMKRVIAEAAREVTAERKARKK